MDLIYVSFSLKPFSCRSPESFEKEYQDVLKPLIKFLYKNPQFKFSFSFNGKQLSYLKKKRSEFLKITSELVARKQVEIYGGSFYNALLPLLQPADRNGQIDLLSAKIRQDTGKLPRGIRLYKDCWEPSLVNNLNSCGIEYALLEESLIPSEKRKFLPIHMSDLSKSVTIFYTSDEFKDDLLSGEFQLFTKKLISKTNKSLKDSEFLYENSNPVVNICFTLEEIKKMFEKNIFEQISEYLKTEENTLALTILQDYLKIQEEKISGYITAGLSKDIISWIETPFEKRETKDSIRYNIHDYLNSYPLSRSLYNRMMYVALLINQSHSDKLIKKSSREILWEGQSGEGIFLGNLSTRGIAFQKLMEAERNLSDTNEFKEGILSFDYDSDGINEYVCRMKDYFAYISKKGGTVKDFQVVKNGQNYADNQTRIEIFDGNTDSYERSFFVDHLFTEEQFSKYINGEVAGDGIFSRVNYREIKSSLSRREVILQAQASFGNQKVILTKKYLINSSGMNVQYIIKNESNSVLKAKFCVESNFANPQFMDNENNLYKVLLATETDAKEIDSSRYSRDCFTDGYLSNINVVQISDINDGISFSFEPNENCSYCFYPLIFKRPEFGIGEPKNSGLTLVSTLFWDLDVEPGKETEKNFNFTIYATHKLRKKR